MAAKKTFKELYEEELRKPTAAQEFVKEVSKITHRSEVTVRMWLSGRQVPDELAQTIIAERYKVDVKTLFPREEQNQYV
jgi:hypothetical protein